VEVEEVEVETTTATTTATTTTTAMQTASRPFPMLLLMVLLRLACRCPRGAAIVLSSREARRGRAWGRCPSPAPRRIEKSRDNLIGRKKKKKVASQKAPLFFLPLSLRLPPPQLKSSKAFSLLYFSFSSFFFF
jgi:hypothetical protein